MALNKFYHMSKNLFSYESTLHMNLNTLEFLMKRPTSSQISRMFSDNLKCFVSLCTHVIVMQDNFVLTLTIGNKRSSGL